MDMYFNGFFIQCQNVDGYSTYIFRCLCSGAEVRPIERAMTHNALLLKWHTVLSVEQTEVKLCEGEQR